MNRSVFIPLVLMSLLLTGCWDKSELNDVSIVTGIAVDPGEEKKYKLTVEVVNSSEFSEKGGEGNAPVITYSLEGESLSELSNKMNMGLTRELIFSHTRVLFINEQIAKEGLFGFLDFLERSGHFRNDFDIIITNGNPASDFTQITFPTQKIPSLKLHQQIDTFRNEWGGDPYVRLTDFLSAIISKGRNPVAATVILKGDAEKGSKVESNKSLDPEGIVVLDGSAVFKEDKMIGTLSLEETRSYTWTQDLIHTSLSIPCDGENENGSSKELYTDFRIINSKTKMKAKYKNNIPQLEVMINGEAKIQGIECQRDLTKIDVFKDYEKEMKEYIKKDITSMIQRVQEEYKVDIFGFGEALNRQHPQKFKEVESEWDEEFARAEINVRVDMHLLRTGIKNKGFMSEIPEKKE